MKRFALCAFLVACHAPPAATPQPPATAPPPTTAPHEELGSLRNARVALPRQDGRALTYFVMQLSDEHRRELERDLPRVHVLVGLSHEEIMRRAAEAHAVDAAYATPDFLRAAKNLVWVQAQSAGIDSYLSPELVENDRIVMTNMRGVHAPAIADHVFAMLLALTRDLPAHLADRAEGRWNRHGSGVLHPMALHGRTLLVVGLGGIGTEIAQRGHGFGMRVLALRRGSDPAPPFVERVGKPPELPALLAEADVVAIALPLTPETTGLFNRATFAAMKPGSFLINIARGQIVDTAALLETLQSGKLAGACLDVTDPEPLPADHPLWKLPNVVITPHVASDASLTDDRRWQLFRENLRRFDAGEPLLNVVDKRAGY
jgi:phosphoglycerate dehydrogenase-like enzyme